MSSKKTLISVAVGSAFAATLGAAPVAVAADNPFAMQSLDKGYMVAGHNDMHGKMMKDGMCGEGKCGANAMMKDGKCGMMSMADANKDGKISKEEADKMHASMFESMDANKDGVIDKDEMAKMYGGKMKDGQCGGKKMGSKMKDGQCGASMGMGAKPADTKK